MDSQSDKLFRSMPGPMFKPSAAVIVLAAILMAMQTTSYAANCAPLLQQQFNRLQDGQPVDLCQYSGNVLLVVNTASYCGFTDQYGSLEDLYRRYREKGLVVLGFPANDFGNQEPGNNTKIASFCRLTYGVQFPMFEKSSVVGTESNPLYVELYRRTGQQPRWNFHKYLIDRQGEKVLSFDSSVTPDDTRLLQELTHMLEAPRSTQAEETSSGKS